MNDAISKIAALEWSKVIGIGFALAAFYYFLMYNDGSSMTESIAAAQTRLQTAQKQLGETEKALENANRFEAEVQATARQFEKIVDFMPMTLSAADLTAIVNKQVQMAGVRASSIKPKADVVRADFYETAKVELELEGSFSQLVSFLSFMSRVPRLLTFEQTSIAQAKAGADNASSILTYKTTLVGYRYLKDAAVDPKAPGAAAVPGGK